MLSFTSQLLWRSQINYNLKQQFWWVSVDPFSHWNHRTSQKFGEMRRKSAKQKHEELLHKCFSFKTLCEALRLFFLKISLQEEVGKCHSDNSGWTEEGCAVKVDIDVFLVMCSYEIEAEVDTKQSTTENLIIEGLFFIDLPFSFSVICVVWESAITAMSDVFCWRIPLLPSGNGLAGSLAGT